MNHKQDHISHLLKKYRAGLCTKNELIELTEYLKGKEGKETLIKDMSQSFASSIEDTTMLSDETSQRMRDRLVRATHNSTQTRAISLGVWLKGLAASILLVVTGWWVWQNIYTEKDIEWRSMSTAMGQQKKIELPDGSTIFLNGNSEITFPSKSSSLDYRIIKLKGEAFFDIETDSIKPFFVVTPNFSIKVLGTSFNVDTELEQAVTVHEGKVQVMKIEEEEVIKNLSNISDNWVEFVRLNKASPPLNPIEYGHKPGEGLASDLVLLTPFEKAEVKADLGLSKVNVTNTNNWMHKDLAFYDQPLELVTQQLERYYGTEIEVAPHLSGCKITLAANKKTLDEALSGLTRLIKNGHIVPLENGKQITGTSCQ